MMVVVLVTITVDVIVFETRMLPNIVQNHFPMFNFTKVMNSVLGTNGNKIGAIRSIIPIL